MRHWAESVVVITDTVKILPSPEIVVSNTGRQVSRQMPFPSRFVRPKCEETMNTTASTVCQHKSTRILPDTIARHATLAFGSHLREGCCPAHQHQHRRQPCPCGPHTSQTARTLVASSPHLFFIASSLPFSHFCAQRPFPSSRRWLLHTVAHSFSFYPTPSAVCYYS